MREMVIVSGKRAGEKERIIRAIVLIVVNKDTAQMNVKIYPISNNEMKKDRKKTQSVSDVDRKVIANQNVQKLVNQSLSINYN